MDLDLESIVSKLRAEMQQHDARTVQFDKSYICFQIEQHIELMAHMKQNYKVKSIDSIATAAKAHI